MMALPDETAAGDGGGGRPPVPVAATKKSAWTKEEDAVLREQVRLHGAQNWAAITEALPGRNAKSCRLRWCQHLSPAVDTAKAFTPHEDAVILTSYRMYPHKWATIATFLQGRTDNAIKNRWHSVLGKVYQQQQRAAAAAAAAPVQYRLPDGALVLFPLAPGDAKASAGRDVMVPVFRRPPPGSGVDLSGQCLKLFPLVPGDLVRGDNAGEAAPMDVDYSAEESLVQLRL